MISDLRMPDMDGAALADEIGRRWPGLKGRIVLITGDALGADPAAGSAPAACRSSRSRSTSRRSPPIRRRIAGSPRNEKGMCGVVYRGWGGGGEGRLEGGGGETGARILVVDDEPDLRALLSDYLGMQGYEVGAAADAAELDARLAEAPADVIVLDINMPGETGLEALARLRAQGLRAGVILLTAAGTLGDRLAGLGDGADDYVVKPFEPRELLARIRAVLRRLEAPGATAAPASAPRRARAAHRPPHFDTEARCLRGPDGAEIPLTAIEFDLLSVFARHPRQTLSRSRLAELAHGRRLRRRPLDGRSHHPAAPENRRGRPRAQDAAHRARRRLRLRPGGLNTRLARRPARPVSDRCHHAESFRPLPRPYRKARRMSRNSTDAKQLCSTPRASAPTRTRSPPSTGAAYAPSLVKAGTESRRQLRQAQAPRGAVLRHGATRSGRGRLCAPASAGGERRGGRHAQAPVPDLFVVAGTKLKGRSEDAETTFEEDVAPLEVAIEAGTGTIADPPSIGAARAFDRAAAAWRT